MITDILDWIKTNWESVVAIYTGLVAVASIIVKLTPTIKDDAFLLKVIKFISKYIALNRTTKDDAIRKLRE